MSAAPPQLVFTAQDYRRLIEAADQIDAGVAGIKFAIDEWDRGANRLTRRIMRLDLGALESDATIVRCLVKRADLTNRQPMSHLADSSGRRATEPQLFVAPRERQLKCGTQPSPDSARAQAGSVSYRYD